MSSDVAIRVEGMGKRYRLGAVANPRYATLRDSLVNLWKSAGRSAPKGEDFWALRDVSFEVRRGDVVGIVGRNGAGKSTLLKLLSRITEPTEGGAEIHGRVGSLLEVGTGFNPELTGRENVFLNGAILGMRRSEIAAKFDEIVAFAEVEKFIDTPAKRYSSGMYMRLAFAVAANLEPEILIVDEVLAVGDISFQKKCLGKMGEVANSGRTVLFVSHNMQAVLSLTRTVVALQAGRVWRVGPTEEVVRAYQNDLTVADGDGVTDLTRSVRKGGDRAIRLTSVSLLGDDGRPRPSFSFGQPIRVAVDFVSDIASTEFEIGLGVLTLEGTMLFVSSSSDGGQLFQVSPGAYRIEMEISPNWLKPGLYWMGFGITCGTLRDYIPEGCRLEIDTGTLVTKSPLVSLPGAFQFDYQWGAPTPC